MVRLGELGYARRRPFKSQVVRRYRTPTARYRVRNWRAYEAGLGRRGDLTLWVDDAALAGWRAPRRSTPGCQPRYADLAIEAVLSLRLVFQLALRQATGEMAEPGTCLRDVAWRSSPTSADLTRR